MSSIVAPRIRLRGGATLLTFIFVLSCLLIACGDDEGGEETDCGEGRIFDETLQRCVRIGADTSDDVDATGDTLFPDASDQMDAGDEDSDMVPPEDTEEVEMIDPECDQDGDGVLSMECGGSDCDDNNFARNPGRDEVCDEFDNDCNTMVNDGLSCFFYAHSGDALYRVDPFQETATEVTGIMEMPTLTDIDTHPNGTLYGITAFRPGQDDGGVLYRFSDVNLRWELVGQYPGVQDATGLAIDSTGTGWVTAGDSVWRLNLQTAEATLVGGLGGDWYSSGDCVLNKTDTFFMTSKEQGQPDTLVLVSQQNGNATEVGNIGFSNVFGLTFAWGKLYGLNSFGEMIEIDPMTGEGTLITDFGDFPWYGAASYPTR